MAFEQNEIKKVIEIDVGNSTVTLKDLVNQVEALKKSLNGMDTSTAEYKTKLNEYINAQANLNRVLGITKDTANSTSNSLKKLSAESTTSTKILGQAGKTGTDIFQNGMDDALNKVINSTMGLNSNLGTVIKTMIQTGKAALNSGKQMATATAMATGGLTLIIDAIVLCIAYWEDISKAVSKATDWVKNLVGIQPQYTQAVYDSEAALYRMNKQLEDANELLNFQLRLMKAKGATEVEINKARVSGLSQQLDELNKEFDKALAGGASSEALKEIQSNIDKTTSAIKTANQDLIISRIAAQTKEEQQTKTHHSNLQQATKTHIDKEKQQREKQVEEILNRLHQANTDELILLQEKYEEEKKLLEDAGKDTLQLTEEYEKKRKEIIIKQRQELQAELDEQFESKTSSIEQERTTAKTNLEIETIQSEEPTDPIKKIEQEQELLDAQFAIEEEYYAKRIAAQQEYVDSFIGSEEQKAEAITKLQDLQNEYALKEAKYQKESTDKSIKLAAEEKSRKENVAKATLQISQAMFGALSDLMEEGSEEQKIFSIMETTIATLTGAIEAYKSMASIPIVGPALGAAAAAAVTIAGAANIAKIKDTTKDNATSQLSSSAMPQLSMTQVTPLLDENADLNRLTTLNEEGESAQNQQNVRVYVVDQDIRDANYRAEVVQNNATF